MVCLSIPPVLFGLIQICFIFGFFFILTVIFFVTGKRREILDNFEQYQCNPFIILTAETFGKNSQELQEKCNFQTYEAANKKQLPSFINVVGSVSESVSSAGNIMSSMDYVLDSVQDVFQSGFSKILSQVSNTSSAAQYLIIKMETLLQRLAASLVIIMYTLNASMQGVVAIRRDKTLLKAVDTVINFPSF